MDDGKPMKNSIDYMSNDDFGKFRDQFRKHVKPNLESGKSDESAKKKKETDEKSGA
jgi:hypothetical protein